MLTEVIQEVQYEALPKCWAESQVDSDRRLVEKSHGVDLWRRVMA